jgi:hypothetical protein
VSVAAPPQAVWEAISTVEGWKSWAVPVAWADGDTFETSYNPAARPGDPMNIKNQFVASVPGRRLTFHGQSAAGLPAFRLVGADRTDVRARA